MRDEGLTQKEVADRLGISVRTVEDHVEQLRIRTNARSTVSALSRARARAPSAHA